LFIGAPEELQGESVDLLIDHRRTIRVEVEEHPIPHVDHLDDAVPRPGPTGSAGAASSAPSVPVKSKK
jgi:hypothetical protein